MTTVDEPQTSTGTRAWVPAADAFGARLALVRQRMGWGNVKTAAVECGLPVETWRTWERDNVTPSRLLTIAQRIALRTGVDYLWLVHGPGRGMPEGPADGGGVHTQRKAQPAPAAASLRDPIGHLVRTVGAPDIHNHAHTRPVTQTRPTSRAARRPVTPVAV